MASPMNGGDGPQSYARNSSLQKEVVDIAMEMMNTSIMEHLDFINNSYFKDSNTTFRIADFGCSVGPNTFFAMDNVIEAVERKYRTQLQNPTKNLEFQVFFNDITSNDFNTLFKTLPRSRKYFGAGVPGSFQDRLFPNSTLHVAHSSSALHWLSKVPEEILDKKSLAFNRESIYCSGTVAEVVKAYSTQFKNDFNDFLNARALEIVHGGLMVIVLPGLLNGFVVSDTKSGAYYDLLGSCLAEMAKLGILSKDKMETFNLPMYFSTPKEMEDIVKRNGHFSILRMEDFYHLNSKTIPTPEVMFIVLKHLRAAFEGIMKQHFGDDVVDKIFESFAKKVEENYFMVEEVKQDQVERFVLLKRNFD